jgi:hypothetical protein
VVCGWSGDWDAGLRQTIRGTPSRRFTTFWATTEDPSALAQQLIDQRRAVVVPIESADKFLDDLRERVAALSELERTHPTSIAALVTALKRYIPDVTQRIRLDDLVRSEAEHTFNRLAAATGPASSPVTGEVVLKCAEFYEVCCERSTYVIVVGAAWATPDQQGHWQLLLRRVASVASTQRGGNVALLELRWYPCLLHLYAGGLAAIARHRFDNLAAILLAPGRDGSSGATPLALSDAIRSGTYENAFHPKGEKYHTARSERLFQVLREPLRDLIPDEDDYANAFDVLEILIGALNADAGEKWLPPGRYFWRWRRDPRRLAAILDSIAGEGGSWGPVRAGLFGGSIDRAQSAVQKVREYVVSSGIGW